MAGSASRGGCSLDLHDGGAGGGAVKVASLPFPSLSLGDSAADRRDALPKSSEEAVCRVRGKERRLEPGWVA